MSEVKSKNLYELLGNDEDQDSDKEPAPPPKVVDKPAARKGKRDAPATGPTEGGGGGERGGRGGRRGGFQGSEQAFQDRDAGSSSNRSRAPDDGVREDRHSNQIRGGRVQGNYEGRGGRGGGRGGRGGRAGGGGRGGGDRANRGFPNDHVKQADQSWGAPTGDSEWQDEKAGEDIAKAEEKDEGGAGGWDAGIRDDFGDGPAPPNGDAEVNNTGALPEEPTEEEDKSRSYADYLAEQAEKKLQLNAPSLQARKPNEGSKVKKEWENAKPIPKEEEGSDAFMKLGQEKAKRERAKKEKNVLDVDLRYVEPNRGGGERGRGRGRGGDRGGFRGRGDNRGRGEFRGRGGGGRGRGGYEGSAGGKVNVEDQSAFPSLGGS